MVVREDGTKWACQSCLKGHRVSGCTHIDRELTLVPKKGRPVTQCQHCRQERKKRSAHVKCDCAEGDKQHHPKEKCIHLREAEERAKAGFHDEHHHQHHNSQPAAADDPHHLAAVAEEQGCCCGHGGKCSCSLIKKEPPAKDGTPPHGPAVQKPRLESTRSDGSITVFSNGHHKPVHKRNHAAHESGMPYKMPLPRHSTDQSVAAQARRSVDSLALDANGNNMAWKPTAVNQPPARGSVAAGRRMSKSEQPSPTQNAAQGCTGGFSDSKLNAIDFSTLGPVRTNQSIDSTASDIAMFPSFDPMSGLADASYDPWSAYPSADSNAFPNNNPFGVWATNFDHSNVAQPALTAASSGTQSEIDELPTMDDMYGMPMPSIQEDFTIDGNSGDGSNSNRRSLPPNFFGNTDFTVPPSNEWQTAVGDFEAITTKSKSMMNDQALGMPDVWNTPTMPTMTSISQRPTTATAYAGRPSSHSIGPGSAPNEDLMKQLFPDLESYLGTTTTTTNSPMSMESATIKRYGGLPMNTSCAGSAANLDLGPMDETNADFTSQPWSDGSMSVPNDAFADPYNLDQDFSNQDWINPSYQ